jgi:hypothetical protein
MSDVDDVLRDVFWVDNPAGEVWISRPHAGMVRPFGDPSDTDAMDVQIKELDQHIQELLQ